MRLCVGEYVLWNEGRGLVREVMVLYFSANTANTREISQHCHIVKFEGS